MAQGALARSRADVAVAVSGIAGPGGGTAEKPVGTVCLGLAALDNGAELPGGTWTKTVQLWGSRDDVRQRTATHALAMVRRYLLGQQV
jgi:nicotinamide-nucleotide amidase